ncbi:hypothetical protein RLIN73S_05537 [Rhodanobacter lindaniclasticus]
MNAALKSLPSAPALDPDKLALLARLTQGLAPADLYWIAAYSAAAAARGLAPTGLAAVAEGTAGAAGQLTIVYGSQTGNSRRVAEQLAGKAEASGLSVRLLRAGAYPLRELVQERHLGVVISSQGDGDPPDDAIGFVEFIAGKRAPKLPQLKFAVLGLGDSSYPKYCAVSQQLDARLAELGGSRFAELGEADVDFESAAAAWSEHALAAAREALNVPAAPPRQAPALHAVHTASAYSREQPFAAAVLENQRIVSRDSERDVRHIELSLQGSGLRYEAGDAVGVWPRNPPSLVEQWLLTLKLDGAAEVEHDGKRLPLARWLSHERELTRLTRPLVAAQATKHADLRRVLEPGRRADFAALLESHQPIDLLREFPAAWDAAALVAALRPLTPRLYSIASSPKAVGPDEVHLTVAVVEYMAHGCAHVGAASSFLAAAGDDEAVPVFIEPNERFRLPADGSRDVIMIGPGTGVAPFRAFVQEREATGASGRNWLFFGNRHFAQDFLYQVEWQEALRRGSLSRLDLAFSRDGFALSKGPHRDVRGVARDSHKTYVQNRLREHGRELYGWLREGAHLYVCGDSTHMAKDVNDALLEIVATHGGLSADDARAWLTELLAAGALRPGCLLKCLRHLEHIKTESRFLRGTIAEGLADAVTGACSARPTPLHRRAGRAARTQPQGLPVAAEPGTDGGTPRPAVGAGCARHRSVQPPAQGRADAACAGRVACRQLDRRPAPPAIAQPRCDRLPRTPPRPLEAAPAGRLDGSRHRPIPRPSPIALPPAVGSGLRLDRRHSHHPPLGAGHGARRHPLLRLAARVRVARHRLIQFRKAAGRAPPANR